MQQRPTTGTTNASGEKRGVDPELREAVEGVVVAFAKALRAQHLYESASPMFAKFVDALRDRFQRLWEVLPSLTVAIREDRLVWEGETVYRTESRTDPLVYSFYKDGVREITFFPGFAQDELDRLLQILGRAHHLRPEEDDLLTLLWDHDWNGFLYQYIELPTDGMEVPSGRQAAPAAVAAPRDEPRPPPGTVRQEDFLDGPYFLDEAELRTIRQELRGETERDLWRDVLFALLDRLEDGRPARQAHIVGLFDEVLPALLAGGNLRHAAILLAGLRELLAVEGCLAPQVRRSLSDTFDRLAAPEAIDELVRAADELPTAELNESLGPLLEQYPPEAIGPMIRAVETVPLPSVRGAIAAVVDRLGRQTPAAVVRLLESDDQLMVLGATRLCGQIAAAGAVPALSRLLGHDDARIRSAAVEALLALGSPGTNGAVQERLDDPDREVRLAVVRTLMTLRYSPARKRLEEAIASSRVRDADVTERIAFFEAYGSAAGAEGVPLLDRLLNGRSWMGRRETAELRACAALGLGRTRAPAARAALQKAADETDPVVRSAVGRALRLVTS